MFENDSLKNKIILIENSNQLFIKSIDDKLTASIEGNYDLQKFVTKEFIEIYKIVIKSKESKPIYQDGKNQY